MAETETKPGPRAASSGERSADARPDDRPGLDSSPADTGHSAGGETAAPAGPDVEGGPTDSNEDGAPGPARRSTKLMVELSRAMQAAAEASRDETLARLASDATAVVDEIKATAARAIEDLRRRADDDVAAVRDWSKTEIARIREETDRRIADRKAALDREIEAQDGTVQSRVERVATTVTEFESRMAAFMERLGGEEDPTRIATMAETMPDPPDLSSVAASIPDPRSSDHAQAGPPAGWAEGGGDPRLDFIDAAGPLSDLAAAEAEAAALAGNLDDDPGTDEAGDGAVEGDSPSAPTTPPARLDRIDDDAIERSTTQITVRGLVSVASIASFKRGLNHVPGVSTIGVASGPDGEFLFSVSHRPATRLVDAIVELPGFDARVTSQTTGAIQVVARDPDLHA